MEYELLLFAILSNALAARLRHTHNIPLNQASVVCWSFMAFLINIVVYALNKEHDCNRFFDALFSASDQHNQRQMRMSTDCPADPTASDAPVLISGEYPANMIPDGGYEHPIFKISYFAYCLLSQLLKNQTYNISAISTKSATLTLCNTTTADAAGERIGPIDWQLNNTRDYSTCPFFSIDASLPSSMSFTGDITPSFASALLQALSQRISDADKQTQLQAREQHDLVSLGTWLAISICTIPVLMTAAEAAIRRATGDQTLKPLLNQQEQTQYTDKPEPAKSFCWPRFLRCWRTPSSQSTGGIKLEQPLVAIEH